MQPVTVVVVLYNSARHLDRLAVSLQDVRDDLGPDCRIVLVDNDSVDDSVARARRLVPDAQIMELRRNIGYAGGVNAGIEAGAPSGPIVVLNPDLVLREGSLRALVGALEGNVGIAVPRLVDIHGLTCSSLRREPSIARVWSESLLGGRLAARLGLSEVVPASSSVYGRGGDVEWATGAAMAISRECHDHVGAWDESFFLYSEEVDYCRRTRRAGFRVRFVPRAIVEHEGGNYGRGDPQLWSLLVCNRIKDFGRLHSRPSTFAFRTGLLVGELLRIPVSAAHRQAVRTMLSLGAVAPDRCAADSHPPGFVWFAAQDWWYHNQAHSDFQLMKEVARHRKVLVVNSIGLRLPTPSRSTKPGRRVVRKVRSIAKLVRRPLRDVPGFHVMTPVFLPVYGRGPLAVINAWCIRQQVRFVARAIGIGSRPHIGVTIPTAWPVVAKMGRASILYNRSDLHSAFPEADGRRILELEQDLLLRSDGVLYVSHELMRRDATVVGPRGFFLDHGVDLDHFSSDGRIVAPEVDAIPHPRIGFFGGLDDYVVDMELLRRTAESLADVHVVLVGDATCSMQELIELPNVHWLGPRPYSAIPALGRGFDVALMPWLDNEWIRYANPIKLKEYLALGLPVVTTEYPEIEPYRTHVLVAERRESFPELVRRALDQPGDPEARRKVVAASSWAARAATLMSFADQIGAA